MKIVCVTHTEGIDILVYACYIYHMLLFRIDRGLAITLNGPDSCLAYVSHTAQGMDIHFPVGDPSPFPFSHRDERMKLCQSPILLRSRVASLRRMVSLH